MSIILRFAILLIMFAWGNAYAFPQAEGLVALKGKIVDAATGEPVEARVTYERLPHGNVTGIRHFEGDYLLMLPQSYTYRIQVSSRDYLPLEVSLTTSLEDTLEQNFYLKKAHKPGNLIQLPDKILFDRGEAAIDKTSYQVLQTLADILKENPGMHIRLEGHTDQGDRRSLLSLSEERVEAVKDYLIRQGIDKKRIKTKAFGGMQPLSTQNTPDARSLNRRVEIRIVKM